MYLFFIFYISGCISTTVTNINYRILSRDKPNGSVLMLILTSFENSNLNEIEPNIHRFRARSSCQHPYIRFPSK